MGLIPDRIGFKSCWLLKYGYAVCIVVAAGFQSYSMISEVEMELLMNL